MALEPRCLLSASLGINLEPLTDWSRSFMLVDAMRSARAFGSPSAPWDASAPLDSHGWPTADFGAAVITLGTPQLSAQDVPPIDGTYHLSALGNATISGVASLLSVQNQRYDPDTHLTTADIVVSPGAKTLYLSFTHTNGGLQDLQLIRPGYDPLHPPCFTTAFLNSIRDFQTLRLMDFTQTNNNTVVNWADRTEFSDALQSGPKGAAWEYGIALAQATNKDLWINIPARASDDYVTGLATLLHAQLSPGRHVYLEYSNEVWNSLFGQYSDNLAQARLDEAANPALLNYDNSANPTYWAWRRVVTQLEHHIQLFSAVYGPGDSTLRPVLASQIGYSYVLRNQLDFLDRFYGTQSLYAIAGAPYLNLGSQATNPALTEDQVISTLQAAIAPMLTGLAKYEALARYYSLHNLCYESGLDLQGDSGGNFLNAKLPANYDPRITGVLLNFLNALAATGVETINYYALCGTFSAYGCWGLTENIFTTDNPKFAAIHQFAASPPPAITIGTAIPPAEGVTLEAGSFLADNWEGTGPGGTITWPNAGATYDYLIRSPGTNPEILTLGLLSTNTTGMLEVLLDNQSLATLHIGAIGAGQLPPIPLIPGTMSQILPAGVHTLRLRVLAAGFNLTSLGVGAALIAPPPVIPIDEDQEESHAHKPAKKPAPPSSPWTADSLVGRGGASRRSQT